MINLTEITEKLNNLEIDPKKKEKFGEVPTPIHLINEMLDRLPHSIWKDPNKTWLDPATGIGSFQVIVYERLIKGLESWEPNLEKRHDHIIRSMLYMSEINRESVKQARKVFGKQSNIIQGDFLKHDFQNKTFDVILGNPPFNAGQNVEDTAKRGSGNPIWIDFVEKSLKLLCEKGYLLFVHPPGWRKPTTESSKTEGMFKKMAHDRQLEYLEIHDKVDGLNTFGVQTRYDWYLLENHPCNKPTIVKDESGKTQSINLRHWSFLPNSDYSLIKRILAGPKDKHIDILYSRSQYATDASWTSETESKQYKYPLIHSTPKGDEPRYYWSNTVTPPIKDEIKQMFGKKKVIFGESGFHNNTVLDSQGKYGMTQGAMAIPFLNKKEGLKIKSTIESPNFERILKAMSFGNFRIDWRIFLFMKHDFYKYINSQEKSTKKYSKKNQKIQKQKNNKTFKKSSKPPMKQIP